MGLLYNNPSLPVNRDGSNRNKTNKNIQANEVLGSIGFNVSRGPSGTQIEAQEQYLRLGDRYVGEYSASYGYLIGDIVTTQAKEYETGTSTPAGTWVCVSPMMDEYDAATVAAYPELARLSGIKYAPFLPEPETLAHEVTNLATQGRYWKQMGGGTASSFKGEWNPALTYNVGDTVIVRGGINAGYYIANQNVPTGSQYAPVQHVIDPTQGIYWVQLACNYTLGSWN